MERSLSFAPGQVAEHGFFSSPRQSGGLRSDWQIFTSGQPDAIPGEQIIRHLPSESDLARYGLKKPDVFLHTHPNYDPPSRPGKDDLGAAKALDMPVAVIDKGGNIFCVLPPRMAKKEKNDR